MKYKKYPYLEKFHTGVYYAYYIDTSGQRRRQSLKERNELRAMSKFKKLLEDVDKGILGFSRIPQNLPFDEIVKRYLDEGTAELSLQSVRRHKQVFENQLKPYFKKASLKSITPKQVLRYINKRRKDGIAPNTLHKELAGLSAVFNFAIQEELLTFNPVKAVKKPKIRVRRPFYVPDESELMRILNHLYKGAVRFFLALLNTGCRLAEIQNVNIGDADLERGVLWIIRKGGKRQAVPINSSLREIIQVELKERGNPKAEEPLFLNNHGQRYKRITRSLHTACVNAKVAHCTHHSLRHAYATLLREKGEKIEIISQLLGHANPTITQNIYIHWKNPEVMKAAEAVNFKLQKSANSQNVLPFSQKSRR